VTDATAGSFLSNGYVSRNRNALCYKYKFVMEPGGSKMQDLSGGPARKFQIRTLIDGGSQQLQTLQDRYRVEDE